MTANCLASTSIGCLFCCQGCNAEKLRNAFVFVPPAPSYKVEDCGPSRDEHPSKSGGGSEHAAESGKLVFAPDGLGKYDYYQRAADCADVRFLRTSRGERVPMAWLRKRAEEGSQPEQGRQPALVMLHCHGNATDIGMMMGPYLEMSTQLGVDVVGVEYSGYGVSSGKPNTRNTYADVEAAYDYVVAAGVPPERIVAYGQSVGSGPVLGLASNRKLGGVVLHSPMLSGIKVIDPEPESCCRPSCMYRCLDFYPNDQRMRSIECPAFVIHGQMDDIIPFYHGRTLAEVAPKAQQWPGYFPTHGGHNDIVERNPSKFFSEVGRFLRSVAERSGVRLSGASTQSTKKPPQMEMTGTNSQDGGGSATAARPFSEPVVGPEDGRYEHWRRGQGQAHGSEIS